MITSVVREWHLHREFHRLAIVSMFHVVPRDDPILKILCSIRVHSLNLDLIHLDSFARISNKDLFVFKSKYRISNYYKI